MDEMSIYLHILNIRRVEVSDPSEVEYSAEIRVAAGGRGE
jgi:hypothetical protein